MFMFKGEFGKLPWPLQYLYNLGVLLSQIINTILGGDPDESFSSRTGKAMARGNWVAINILGPFLDLIFSEKNHALKSIEDDEGKKEIWTWGKRKT